MKIYLLNKVQGLIPLYDSDRAKKKLLTLDQVYLADVIMPRNLQFHRKFFALINVGWANTPMKGISFELYRETMIMKAGYAEVYQKPNGDVLARAQSIAFGNMDQETFSHLYERVLDVIIEDTQADRQLFENELLDFL